MLRLIVSIRVFLTFAILLGLGYPLFIVMLSKEIFPYQTNGSLIEHQGKTVGSALIAQEFTSPKYFQSRFSENNYNAKISGGSNLPVSSEVFYKKVKGNIFYVKAKNKLKNGVKLPSDMVLSSASGLDPHISMANALLQISRVKQYRNLSKEVIIQAVQDCLDPDFIGIWGQDGVNVLRLNLLLDKLEQPQQK